MVKYYKFIMQIFHCLKKEKSDVAKMSENEWTSFFIYRPF